MTSSADNHRRLLSMTFARVYPLYVAKVERKDRTQAELDAVLGWLTGYSVDELHTLAVDDTTRTLPVFFDHAPQLHPNATKIAGVICGYRVEEITDPLLQKIRWMDKLVDELAKGKALEKILRN